MIYEIPLSQIPAQAFSFIVGDYEFYIRLKTLGGKLYMDLSVNGDVVFTGFAAITEFNFLSPFGYLNIPGALFFQTEKGKDPAWNKLGVADKLYYADDE